jgi:hypothetical protein
MIVKRQNRKGACLQKRILRIKSTHIGEDHNRQHDTIYVCTIHEHQKIPLGLAARTHYIIKVISYLIEPQNIYRQSDKEPKTMVYADKNNPPFTLTFVHQALVDNNNIDLPVIQHGKQVVLRSALWNRLMHRPDVVKVGAIIGWMTLNRGDIRLLLLLLLKMLGLVLARSLMRWWTLRGRLISSWTAVRWLICVLRRCV